VGPQDRSGRGKSRLHRDSIPDHPFRSKLLINSFFTKSTVRWALERCFATYSLSGVLQLQEGISIFQIQGDVVREKHAKQACNV